MLSNVVWFNSTVISRSQIRIEKVVSKPVVGIDEEMYNCKKKTSQNVIGWVACCRIVGAVLRLAINTAVPLPAAVVMLFAMCWNYVSYFPLVLFFAVTPTTVVGKWWRVARWCDKVRWWWRLHGKEGEYFNRL